MQYFGRFDDFVTSKRQIDGFMKKVSKYVGLFFKIQKLSWMWIIVIITWCNMCPAHFRRLQTLQKELYLAVSWSKVDPPNPLLHYRLLKLFKYNILHNARVMHNVVFLGWGVTCHSSDVTGFVLTLRYS